MSASEKLLSKPTIVFLHYFSGFIRRVYGNFCTVLLTEAVVWMNEGVKAWALFSHAWALRSDARALLFNAQALLSNARAFPSNPHALLSSYRA